MAKRVAVRLATAPPPPAPPLLTDLLVYWPLSEASGNRSDLHTNGYTLTQVGTLGSAAGHVYDLAGDFDMDTDHGLTRARADAPLINFDSSTPFTIVTWMLLDNVSGGPDSPTYYRTLVTFNAGSSWTGGYHIQTTAGGQIYVSLGKTGSVEHYTNHVADSVLALDAWHMFAWTHDAGELVYYLDGSIIDTDTNAYPFVAAIEGNFYIGIRYGSVQVWDGQIGPVAMFSKALGKAELDWLYNGGAGRSYAELA